MIHFFELPVLQWIRNAADVLVVAYLFYFLYKLFRGTKSISVIKGFFFIVAVYFLAGLIQLKTVAWVFKYVVNYFVILIVVLFQPEIRRILSLFGRSGFSAFQRKISRETIEEISEAVFQMSEESTGALIIIERNMGLRDLVEESVELEATIKSELLLSLFYKGSPLHDGAIILEEDKIVAARVIIPTVKINSLKIRRNVGTRHRAGLAITTETDAFSIIVSEETGKISVAVNGKLEYGLSHEKFLKRLSEFTDNK